MAISILKPGLEEPCRILVFSDINGNLDLFEELLRKVNYKEGDVLVLLGDLMENGPQPLATLRYVMSFARNYPVFCLLGEKDLIYRELLREDRNEELLRYLSKPSNSVIKDMLSERELHPIDTKTMLHAKETLCKAYPEELQFLDSMPVVVELPHFIFAHAKVIPGELSEMNTVDVIRGDAFFEKGYGFEKYVLLGHWPSQCYDGLKIEANPLIQESKKLITLDGGLGRRRDGQLNCVVIPDSTKEEFQFVYVDRLPKGKVLHTQAAGDIKRTIKAPYNQVKIIQEQDDMAYCRQDKTGECFWIPKVMLTMNGEHIVSEDVTDYQLRLTAGDIVSIVLKTTRGYLVKKDGVIGWYFGMLENITPQQTS